MVLPRRFSHSGTIRRCLRLNRRERYVSVMLMFVKPSSGLVGLMMGVGLAALLATPAQALGPVKTVAAPSIRADARSILGQFGILTVVPINPEQAFVEGYDGISRSRPDENDRADDARGRKVSGACRLRALLSRVGPARQRRQPERGRDFPPAQLWLSAKRVCRPGVAPVREISSSSWDGSAMRGRRPRRWPRAILRRTSTRRPG